MISSLYFMARFLVVIILCSPWAASADLPGYIYNSHPDSLFKPTERPDIANSPELAMKGAILMLKNQNKKTNHFCVLGLAWNNGRYEWPVFWMEKNCSFIGMEHQMNMRI
jgi:hypothetical protein